MAASATLALKAGVWFRRGRLLIVSPDSLGTACPLSGRNSTYRPVQILEASSMDEVPDHDAMREYRPITLANHLDFKDAYGKSGAKSSSERVAIASYIEDRLPPNL